VGKSIFLFGGQTQPSHSTNAMWEFDGMNWIKRKINKNYPPEIDNHCSCLFFDTWLVFGGFFGGTIGLHSNYMFQYKFETNDWVKLFPPKDMVESLHAPAPRDGAGIARI
jgi:hypothetical protein